jgi:peptidoglycan/LPS O-acetylase OafA/YrhL
MSIAARAEPSSIEKSVSSTGRRFSLANLFESPASPQRMLALEGMRGVAALMVFFVHFYALLGLYARPNSLVEAGAHFAGVVGNVGVDIFFVISGFLMYGIVLRKPTPILTYLGRRIRRLYPVFLFVFVVYIGLSYAMPMESRIPRSPKAAAVYLLLNLAMLPGMLSIVPLIRVAWSLSYEWFYYLILPFSMWAFRLRRWSPGWRIGFVLALCVSQYVLCSLHWTSHPRLIMFGAGACLWELATHFGIARYLGWRGEMFTIALVIFALTWMGLTAKYNLAVALKQAGIPSVNTPLFFVSFFALALYSLFYNGVLSRFFSITWLRWVGNISYSYYLIHGLTLHFVANSMHYAFGTQPLPAALFLVLCASSMLVTIVVSALLFLAVEKPLSLVSPKPTLAKTPRPLAVPTPVLTSGLQDMEPVRRSNPT